MSPSTSTPATRVDVLKSDFGFTFCEYNARKILGELKTSLVMY